MEREGVSNTNFLLVETVKKRGTVIIKEYSVVPHKWVQNGFLLDSCNKELLTLQKDPNSEPNIFEWDKCRCVIKHSNITSFEEGLLYEEQYSEVNTEDEPNITQLVQKAVEQQFDQNRSHNYNSYFSPITFEATAEPSNILEETEEVVVIEDGCGYITNPGYSESCNKRYDALNQKFDRLHSQMISQRIILERIENCLMKNGETRSLDAPEATEEEILSDKFKFPLNNVTDLKNLNKELESNPRYKTYLVTYLSGICGVDGIQRGDKVGVKLVSDIVFTKQLLTLTSWTGISRSANCEQKVAFRSFENILDLINTVLLKADDRWCKIETEKLFRDKILKHSNKRSAAELKKKDFKGREMKIQGSVPATITGLDATSKNEASNQGLSNKESNQGYEPDDDLQNETI